MSSKPGEPKKNLLIIGLICVVLGTVGIAYEFLRERTPEEKKQLLEDAKLEAERKKNTKP